MKKMLIKLFILNSLSAFSGEIKIFKDPRALLNGSTIEFAADNYMHDEAELYIITFDGIKAGNYYYAYSRRNNRKARKVASYFCSKQGFDRMLQYDAPLGIGFSGQMVRINKKGKLLGIYHGDLAYRRFTEIICIND